MHQRFQDRHDAGRQLATKLERFANRADVLVLGLPRGGIVVADEVAHALHLAIDVFVVRTLASPFIGGRSIGAIASGGVCVLDAERIDTLHVSGATVERAVAGEHAALERVEGAYRGLRPTPDVLGRTILLVDQAFSSDGIALAAVEALRQASPTAIVVAAPVAAPRALARLRERADECVCVAESADAGNVRAWYEEAREPSDEEVRAVLDAAVRRHRGTHRPHSPTPVRAPHAPPA